MIPFTGVGVALLTFFDDNRDVDYEATATHAARLVALGVSAVLVAGTSGEASSLSDDERTRLVEAVVATVDVPVLAGVVAPTTDHAVRLTEDACNAGANCILSAMPHDANPSEHYARIANAASDTPVLAYHHPVRFPPGIDVDLIDSLPVAGSKDSSGDAKRLLDASTRSKKPLYTGASSLLFMFGALNGAGAISGAANAFPELALDAFAGGADAQRELHVQLDAARDKTFPESLKQLTASRFGTPPYFR